MNKKVLTSAVISAFILLALGFGPASRAQTSAARSTAKAGALSYLPASNAVMVIDVRRLLNETLPQVLASDPARLAQVKADIDKLKTQTGIDLRSFDRVVLGMRYVYPSPKVTKIETVAIAHGSFDARALVTAAKIAANGKYREEKYHGVTISVFGIPNQIKVAGLWKVNLNELAACAVDANTLTIGNAASVRAAIDAGRSGQRVNSDLVALANRDPNAVIGFGANVPRELLASLNVGNDTIAKDANSIRQVYGSIGSAQTDVSLLLVARTDTAEAAKNLSDTVTGLKQLGTIFIMRMAEPKKALAQSALDNLKITTRGNELEIRTQFAAAGLAAVIK